MARKDLLKGLMEGPATNLSSPASSTPETSGSQTRAEAPRGRYSGGAIGAVSQSIANLKSRSVAEIDTDLIDSGGVQDRLDDDEADHQALIASIREHGQQVPVLLRPHPEIEGRYQVVYGRRRILALRALGQPVKALVRDLDDRGLVMAQGQENNARKDLSFIEKANFARQMRDMGYDRASICAALHVDKTVISRMMSVIDSLPHDLIAAIGAAPSAGRDRWLVAAEELEKTSLSIKEVIALVNLADDADTSDKRFEVFRRVLAGSRKRETKGTANVEKSFVLDSHGRRLAQVQRGPRNTTLTLSHKVSKGFEDWLLDSLARLHRDWLDQNDD